MAWTFETTETDDFSFGLSGTTIVTSAYSGTVTSGALLLVMVMFSNSVTCDSVSDDASGGGNVYTRIQSTQNRGDGEKISAWFAIAKEAGTPVVTFHFSGSAGAGAYQICSFTHAGTITLDTSSVNTGTGTTSSSDVTTAGTNELVVGFDLPSAFPTGPSAGFTGTAAYTSKIPMVYADEAAAGTYSPGTVTAGSTAWAAISAAFTGSTSVSVTASDTVSFSDSSSRAISLPRAPSDSVSFSDSVARLITAARTATDSASFSDSVARLIAVPRTATDSTSFSDSVDRLIAAIRTATDSASFSDSVAGVFFVWAPSPGLPSFNPAQPQPASPPPGPPFSTLPEQWIHDGVLQITFDNSKGTFFILSNPGRSD